MSPHLIRKAPQTLLMLLVSMALSSAGCSTLSPLAKSDTSSDAATASLLTDAAKADNPGNFAAAPSTCTVEMHRGGRRPKQVEVTVTQGMRVQDALKESKALRRFRRLDVRVVRNVANASDPQLKLKCRFDVKERKIGWESDYALMPGDRILVREDTSNHLDDVLGGLIGPMFADSSGR